MITRVRKRKIVGVACRVLAAVVMLAMLPGVALSQVDGDGAGGPDAGQTDGAGGTSTPADATAGEVSLDVRQIGLRVTRPGEWTGFQVEVLDSGDKARNVFINLEIPDADGDRVVMQRLIVTNPGVKRSVWLYAWQPFEMLRSGFGYRINAYEAEVRPGVTDAERQENYRIVRRIGSRTYPLRPQQSVDETSGLIGVIGASAAGLEQYSACREPGKPWSPTGHELTEVIPGLKPDDLPDRWMGLAALDALVWTGREADEQPSRLGETQVEAIKEWVRRGGHLVVVLPSIGQAWLGGAGGVNPLAEIMPDTRATMVEGVSLEDYRLLLTGDQRALMPRNAVIHRFEPAPGAKPGPYDAMPIMRGKSNDTVVVRRLVGTGAVTLIGLDLARRDLTVRGTLQAQQFWNRILGKRMKVFSTAELAALRDPKDSNTPPLFAYGDRPPVDFDRGVSTLIAKQSKAAKGLLTAFGVFLAYWLLAGPVGYFVLKQRNLRHHAWVAFSSATAAFALVGWGASSTLKLGRDIDKHYTLVDHVYGQSNQRMRSWVELTLPKYGEQRVSVRGPASSYNWRNALAAWEPGGETSSALTFPDARNYYVDTRSPDTADFPARATTRQVQFDYAGAVPANWDMPRPVAAEGVELGREIWLDDDSGKLPATRPPRSRDFNIQGTLVHNLPGPLRDVRLYLVNRLVLGDVPGTMPAQVPAEIYSGSMEAWPAGEALDLNARIALTPENRSTMFENVRGNPQSIGGIGSAALPSGEIPLWRMVHGQAFFPMLDPPDPGREKQVWAHRSATHGWDLGRWFTQPCVIIVGVLGSVDEREAVECPLPITIDDLSADEVRSNIRGVTVIRWVYPLPARPPSLDAGSAPEPAGVQPSGEQVPTSIPGLSVPATPAPPPPR